MTANSEPLEAQRQLLLLRHGKSNWGAGCDDFNRPLKKRGKRAAGKVGRWMKQRQLQPDLILCSPAVRAKETAIRCLRELAITDLSPTYEASIYHAQPETLMKLVAATSSQIHCLLLVGHNPGLELLLEELAAAPLPEYDDGKLMPTATLACLRLPGGWSELQPGIAELEFLIRPRLLEQE